jgi:CHAD domain-containing protein
MAPLSKWIDGLVADGSVGAAARKSLEARLATVAYWLPLAARPVDGDTGRVHQLRVATRRAVAAITLYDDWLPRNPRRWLTKRLKKLRQAAGDTRDLDVLFARLQKELGEQGAEVLRCLAEKRASLQPDIVAIADRCNSGNRMQRRTYALLERIAPPAGNGSDAAASFRNWGNTKLREVAQAFFAAEPAKSADWSALHQFRIAGKKLRYTMELLAPVFGDELRKDHYPVVEQLQAKMGNVNDFVAGGELLKKLRDANHSAPANDQFDVLVGEHEKSRDEAIAEFRSWWTAERAETLRKGLVPG